MKYYVGQVIGEATHEIVNQLILCPFITENKLKYIELSEKIAYSLHEKYNDDAIYKLVRNHLLDRKEMFIQSMIEIINHNNSISLDMELLNGNEILTLE